MEFNRDRKTVGSSGEVIFPTLYGPHWKPIELHKQIIERIGERYPTLNDVELTTFDADEANVMLEMLRLALYKTISQMAVVLKISPSSLRGRWRLDSLLVFKKLPVLANLLGYRVKFYLEKA